MNDPHSARFWWLKRLGALLMLVLVALGLFHWWLTHHVDRRLKGIVDGWRQDPEAPLPEMVPTASGIAGGVVSGEDNAAFLYQRAINALPRLTQRQIDEWDIAEGRQSPVPPEKAELVREIVTAAAPQLAVAREARELEHIDWNLPAIDIGTSANWQGVRQLAVRQGWAMMLAHRDGDIPSAMEYGRDVHRLGSATACYGPSVVAGMVSTGVHALASSRYMDTAWYRPAGMTAEEERAAWRDGRMQVRAAISDLLDEEPGRRIMALSWKGERVLGHSVLAAPAAWIGAPVPQNFLLRPVYEADIARLLELEDRLVQAVETRDAAAILDPSLRFNFRVPESAAGSISNLMSMLTTPSLERANIAFVRSIAWRRMAAVVLAAKLFEADHDGRPQSLEELVPEYLPEVPQDPFAPAGTPLGFRSDTPLPIVYSIGEDLTDNGGSTAPPAGTSQQRIQSMREMVSAYEREDLVFPLYLPPEALEYPDEFNVWHYLQDPQAEIERARKLQMERRELEMKAEGQP